MRENGSHARLRKHSHTHTHWKNRTDDGFDSAQNICCVCALSDFDPAKDCCARARGMKNDLTAQHTNIIQLYKISQLNADVDAKDVRGQSLHVDLFGLFRNDSRFVSICVATTSK